MGRAQGCFFVPVIFKESKMDCFVASAPRNDGIRIAYFDLFLVTPAKAGVFLTCL
jgi:hypothetical protein